MRFLERQLRAWGRAFAPGRRLHRWYPVYEALESFLLTPAALAARAPFVRDPLDLKRVMSLVVLALLPCLAMGIYNTGYQILLARGEPLSLGAALGLGLGRVVPIIMVSYLAGGLWEVVFAVVRRHEINEGFLVTGLLFALTMPPSVPLWQVAVGISFGVVIGKEIFGGTGYNIFNPALLGRAFCFFSYPAQFSGDAAWAAVDGFSRATPLAVLAAGRGGQAGDVLSSAGYTFSKMFYGLIPGSIGETSTAACLLGLFVLLITRVASWRIVAGCVLGLSVMSGILVFCQGPGQLTAFSLWPHWHLVMGGFAFGAVFMATDPVSSAATRSGRWFYGLGIGVLVVLIRVFNPAYAEGTMLAILFMNALAPLIDYLVVEAHLRRRGRRRAGVYPRGQAA